MMKSKKDSSISDNNNENDELYFEKQRFKLCGLHTINNLLQYKAYERGDLEQIAYELDQTGKWINPHKNFFGLGNYDANVMIVALNRKGYDVKWFDKRKNLDEITFNNLYGIIVNCMSKKYFGLWNSRHWFAIKNMNPPLPSLSSSSSSSFHYCVFNSESTPLTLNLKENMIHYLTTYIHDNAEILLVYEQSQEEKQQYQDSVNK